MTLCQHEDETDSLGARRGKRSRLKLPTLATVSTVWTVRQALLYLMKLTSDNYDVLWDRQVRHMFYALDWMPMYDASKNGGRADDTPAAHRRKAWGKVTGSLGGDNDSKDR